MRFIVSSSALFNRLQTIGRVINSKNTLPILDCFLFEIQDNILTITASDSETTLITNLELVESDANARFCINAKTIQDSMKEIAEQPLSFDINPDNMEITANYQNGRFNIVGQSADEYPEMNLPQEDMNALIIPAETMLNGINRCLFATADDELRPIMNGVYINIEPASITFVATDAHKLVKYSSEQPSELTAAFILPKKPANLLKGMLLKEEAPVKVSFDSKNVLFNLKNHTLVCRLIEGSYPNYNAVIPTANPNKVLIDRIELVNGIKRVAVCSNPATNLIRMDIADNKINLTAQDIDYSMSANETISCSYDGQSITIGFKSTFLVEILSNIETPTVVIELADSTRAGVFKPVYDEKQSSDTLMLLMPMMINA